MPALLISTYDLGHQPFGLASAAAALQSAGVPAVCADLSREPLPESAVTDAELIAFFLPMHTATRLALPVIDRVRALNPGAVLCAYGLYAPLNAALLRERGVTAIIGGEFEDDLAALAREHVAREHIARGPWHVEGPARGRVADGGAAGPFRDPASRFVAAIDPLCLAAERR